MSQQPHSSSVSNASMHGMMTIGAENQRGDANCDNNHHSVTVATDSRVTTSPGAAFSRNDEEILQKLSSRGFVDTFRPMEYATGIAVAIVGLLVGEKATPYCRPFLWDDATIANEFKPDTFPVYSLIIMLILAFLCAIAFVYFRPQCAFASSPSSPALESAFANTRRGEMSAVVLFGLHALMLNEFVTGIVKVFDGRLRPDFLSRLESLGYSSANKTVDWCELSHTSVVARDGRLSFPSGHSSTSFMCCTSLSLYLISRLRAWSSNNNSSSGQAPGFGIIKNGALRLLIGSIPMILCFTITVSRTIDNRHHHADILAGAIIGFLSASLSWNLHFISVTEAKMQMLVVVVPASPVPQQSARIDNNDGANKSNTGTNNIQHEDVSDTSPVLMSPSGQKNYNTSNTRDDVGVSNDSSVSSGGSFGGSLPWFLRDENRNQVGDHIPRWFL